MKRATKSSPLAKIEVSISIHALVKRATDRCCNRYGDWHDFNPRPREEGDEKKPLKDVTQAISIHALVKRATQSNRILKTLQPLFQSTPSWRGRQYTQSGWCAADYFNPRPREEGDSTWNKNGVYHGKFQSTPSWRGRLFKDPLPYLNGDISIHALVKRATEYVLRLKHSLIISIHALVKRATSK